MINYLSPHFRVCKFWSFMNPGPLQSQGERQCGLRMTFQNENSLSHAKKKLNLSLLLINFHFINHLGHHVVCLLRSERQFSDTVAALLKYENSLEWSRGHICGKLRHRRRLMPWYFKILRVKTMLGVLS